VPTPGLTGLRRFRHGPPGLPGKHKLFLKDVLGLSGAEVSLNVMRPGEDMPFFHRHHRNEEVYLFIGGRGQVQVDGEVFEVSEGSVVRISPSAARSWRNYSAEDLYFVVIQYPADGHVSGKTSDGVGVPGRPEWPLDDSHTRQGDAEEVQS
jgi:quercetin dioxygenase-like cupin family protein